MSWLDRLLSRDRDTGESGAAAAGAESDRIVLQAFDADGWRTASLDAGTTRVSDVLNDRDPNRLPQLLDGTALDIDDVLLVIPPTQPAGDPARRLHRPAHPLWVRIGEWSVVGSLHLPPGTVGSAFLLRRNLRFFVLTSATITRSVADGREERFVPVLLVNLQQVSSLRDTPEPEPVPSAVGVPRA